MDRDTALGGQGASFPSTLWTNVLHAGDQDEESRRRAWEGLAQRYWKPVYVFVRAQWAKSNEDAKDLTQDFFAWMMETGFPQKADPRRGRFRAFVKAALENYLRTNARQRRREKRGGDRPILTLDRAAEDFGALEVADPSGKTADELLEHAWKETLLTRATTLLEDTYRRKRKEAYFHVFRDYYLASSTRPTHPELAARYALAVSDVNNYLMDAKRLLREILKDLLAETVTDSRDLEDEYLDLFGKAAP